MSDSVTLDYLFVADHCEVVSGKLYVLGGGWTDLFRPALESATFMNTLSVAVSLCVPSVESNRLHTVTIRVENQDGTTVLADINATFNVGSPPTQTEVKEQHIAGAATFNIAFPSPGSYRVTATVDEKDNSTKEWGFRVHDVAKST